MSSQTFGTIAALEFSTAPDQSFEDIVEEMDISFQPIGLNRRSLIWDTDDTAIIERDTLRVLLSWLPAFSANGSSFLVVAVGETPSGGPLTINREVCDMVKEVLISHLESYLDFGTVFHTEATQPVSTALIDTVTEILRHDYTRTPSAHGPNHNARAWPHDPEDVCDTIFRTGSRRDDTRNPDPHVPPKISLPQRLTIYTLGATMLLYTPPIGASLLVYSTLRDLMPTAA